MSLNQSMNISLGSMKNNQYALTVVSHNIANLHTEGYHRQRVDFQEIRFNLGKDVLAQIKGMNGAQISGLTDFIDDAAFKTKLDSNADANYYNTLADALSGLEDIANDLGDNGLNALLNDFYKAAANLEQFPADMAVRQQFVSAASNVCDKFNDISKKYDNLTQDKYNDVKTSAQTINSLLADLALANEAHAKDKNTATAANINNILEQLSNYMDVATKTNPNGTVNVIIGGIQVVQGGEQKYQLNVDTTGADGKNVKFSLQALENPDYVIEEGINESFKSGSLKAHLDFLNGEGVGFVNVNDMKAALDSAAGAFANALNAIQRYDDGDVFAASLTTDADGNTILEKSNVDLMVAKDGSTTITAGNISINPEIDKDPYKIAAARIDLKKYTNDDGTVDDWTKSIGNADNASEILALQNAKICSYQGGVNNCTLSQFLRNNAVKAGTDLAEINKKADIYQNIADNDADNYTNIIGVNLDEELADMIRYQRAFEASARVFSTVNDLMGTIIGMV